MASSVEPKHERRGIFYPSLTTSHASQMPMSISQLFSLFWACFRLILPLDLLNQGDIVAFEEDLACKHVSRAKTRGSSQYSPIFLRSSGVSFFANVTSIASSMTRFMNSSKPYASLSDLAWSFRVVGLVP